MGYEFMGFINDASDVVFMRGSQLKEKGLFIPLRCRPGVDKNVNTGKPYDINSYRKAMDEQKGKLFPLGFGVCPSYYHSNGDLDRLRTHQDYIKYNQIGYVLFVDGQVGYVIIEDDYARKLLIKNGLSNKRYDSYSGKSVDFRLNFILLVDIDCDPDHINVIDVDPVACIYWG